VGAELDVFASSDFSFLAGLILFFLVGLLARFTDAFENNKRYARFTLASAVAYGFGGGVLAAASPAFASVVLGIVLGVIFGGKVDSRQHQLAVATLFLTALFFNTAPLFIPLAVFAAASYLDEDLHELVSKFDKCGKSGRSRGAARKQSFFETLLGSRVLVELAAVALGVFLGSWVFFASVLAFDAGCYFAPKAFGWFPEH
jgi:hypothetical protein